jgi:lipopolysaccharide transport system ATP-binding protein
MSIAIKIENLSKQYRLGLVSTRTLSHDLNRWWQTTILRKEDPYLKIGDSNDRTTKGNSEYVWALKGINLEVQEGEVLGIIGKNGAGKSTLLKILSKVTSPTTGTVKARGRIASLLEVGTGFHPEMTGRENIYMNGSIMGMNKAEITRKFDEIVAFAGVDRYIDTPVKRYSSGMTVRLGFAIAAHLEPQILIVDEVLAVGDVEFQKKAIGKMQDVSRNQGRTVLFVSHNLNAVKGLCERAILLSNGEIVNIDITDKIIKEYLNSDSGLRNSLNFEYRNFGDVICILLNARIIDDKGILIDHQNIDKGIKIEFSFKIKRKTRGIPNLHLFSSDGSHVLFSSAEQTNYTEGIYKALLAIPGSLLNTGTYVAGLAFTTLSPFLINFYLKDALMFEIIENIKERRIDYVGQIPGVIRPHLDWEINQL